MGIFKLCVGFCICAMVLFLGDMLGWHDMICCALSVEIVLLLFMCSV